MTVDWRDGEFDELCGAVDDLDLGADERVGHDVQIVAEVGERMTDSQHTHPRQQHRTTRVYNTRARASNLATGCTATAQLVHNGKIRTTATSSPQTVPSNGDLDWTA